MKKPFTEQDSADFTGAMQFLELMWGVKVDSEVDLETGKGTVRVWLPGTEAVLVADGIDVRRLMIVERNRARFPDPAP